MCYRRQRGLREGEVYHTPWEWSEIVRRIPWTFGISLLSGALLVTAHGLVEIATGHLRAVTASGPLNLAIFWVLLAVVSTTPWTLIDLPASVQVRRGEAREERMKQDSKRQHLSALW
jgi:hypothetical protein